MRTGTQQRNKPAMRFDFEIAGRYPLARLPFLFPWQASRGRLPRVCVAGPVRGIRRFAAKPMPKGATAPCFYFPAFLCRIPITCSPPPANQNRLFGDTAPYIAKWRHTAITSFSAPYIQCLRIPTLVAKSDSDSLMAKFQRDYVCLPSLNQRP